MNIVCKTGLAGGILITLAACGGSSGGGAASNDAQPVAISWAPCAEDSPLQCATVQVPMDHRDSTSEKIDVALNRMPASGDAPLGSLLFNPGGPGGSGTELIEGIIEYDFLPETITSSYHIVGFDPRGVNKSTPIDCREFDLDGIDDYPLDIEDLHEHALGLQAFYTACSDKYGEYLLHVGSEAVADDMELIRKALQEPALNFVGYSYGTRLAGIYAQKYPATTGRLILDGSLPPSHRSVDLFTEQLEPLEDNLRSLAQTCTTFSDCDPEVYKAQLEARVAALLETESDFELGLLATLLFAAVEEPDMIPQLAGPLYQYMQDFNPASLVDLALQFDSDDDPDFDPDSVGRAVICADDPARPSVAEIEALRPSFNAQSDLFAEAQMASAMVCTGWPDSLNALPEIATTQAPAALVIGGPTDALTPIAWSEQMAAAIGGQFLRSEHVGHTTVFSGANVCTDNAAIDFLLNGTLPAVAACSPDDSQ